MHSARHAERAVSEAKRPDRAPFFSSVNYKRRENIRRAILLVVVWFVNFRAVIGEDDLSILILRAFPCGPDQYLTACSKSPLQDSPNYRNRPGPISLSHYPLIRSSLRICPRTFGCFTLPLQYDFFHIKFSYSNNDIIEIFKFLSTISF